MRLQRWWRACVLVGAVAIAACTKPTPPRPQHILLIVIDTLRADHLSVFGYPRPTSPNIDRLARNGVLCTRAISQSSFTSPSMVSLMTGHYIAKERLTVPADLATLAESFQRAGWKTAGFAANGLICAEHGFARGFDEFHAIVDYGSNEPIEQFLAAHKDQRTFTFVHIKEPHDPYVLPGERVLMKNAKPQWREAASHLPGDRGEFYKAISDKLGLSDLPANVRRIQEEIGGYDDDVKYADERVAALLGIYNEFGVREQMTVALTADHGEGLWEHVALMNGQRGAKLRAGEKPTLFNTLMPTHGNQVHRELVHVPIVLSGVGMPRGKPINAPVENVDLFPTLLELADIKTPGGLQGRSLLARLDREHDEPSYAFSFTRFNATVIDDKGWALILPTAEGECAEEIVLELFQINDDPSQRINRAAEKPELVARLTEIAHARMAKGIREGDATPVSEQTRHELEQLGYTEQVDLADARTRIAAEATGDLVARIVRFETPCTERLRIAEELAKRDLDAAAKDTLAAWKAKETSRAVRDALEHALAR